MGCCEADPGDGAGSGVRGCVLKKYDIFGRELYCKRLFLRMFHANKRFRVFHSNGGLFRTIVNGNTLFLYLFHGLLEVCAVFMPISILIEAPCTFFTPKNSMKKTRGASNFLRLPTFFVPE